MLNKISAFASQYNLIKPGDHIVCAVSGGADSMALLWAMYLLREKMQITVSAAHFNHNLRGAESDRDQAFVEDFCRGYGIPLYLGSSRVQAGKKGLEAAAREARYDYFSTLSGKIATAHTADDNAETVLMHLIRGTGLKGLGGINPVRRNVIRPMLTVTRQQVCEFLREYSIGHIEDSSNESDAFLRNRIRHHILPLMGKENPSLSENVTQMALRLRQDEEVLQNMASGELPNVSVLRQLPISLRSRYLASFLEKNGVREPEGEHIALADSLVFSEKPSAKADFPGGVVIGRNYDRLEKMENPAVLTPLELACPGSVELTDLGIRIHCQIAENAVLQWERFTVYPKGTIRVRTRQTGDSMRLQGGNKSLKELMIDKKIPAAMRGIIPVLADDTGVLAVWGIGANLDRISGDGTSVEIWFENIADL